MKTALITGATSGIGREFARVFSKMGYRLILTGRREERLKSLSQQVKTPTRIITADLSREEECYKLLEELGEENIDVFINNAGLGICGPFTETDLEQELQIIKVNDLAMHILFKGILRKMAMRDRGMICNVASSAGLMPAGPYMASYYASKAYVVSLTKAVAEELRQADSFVHVCALCPGPVDTEFNDVANVRFAMKGISPAYCVREAIRGMRRGKIIIVPSFKMKLAMWGQSFLPDRILVPMAGKVQKRKMSPPA